MSDNQKKLRTLFLKIDRLGKSFNSKLSVKVGIQKGTGKHANSDETVAAIAAKHEFGDRAQGIPERSFMRSTLHEKSDDYREFVKVRAKKVINGKLKYDVLMANLGEQVQDDIKGKITAIRTPPNSAETIARKGSDNPLIDTSEMRNSMRYKLDKE